MVFSTLKDSFRFAKALECGKAWIKYEKYCNDHGLAINPLWVSIIRELVNNEKAITLIDPDLFISGSSEEIKSFLFLI